MKNVISIEKVWGLQYDLSGEGEHQLILPAICHAPYGEHEDNSSLFATSKSRLLTREGRSLST
ncbi:hypothetical protein U8V72_23100 [Priestia filamentosa]|uniref:hypothetical protein n=1 Tax=Priestia filamentosa TaxID=1402861 RepID=UPI00397B742B